MKLLNSPTPIFTMAEINYIGVYRVCDNQTKVDWLIKQLHAKEEWAFDSETSGAKFLSDYIFILSFSWAAHTGYCIDFRYFSSEEQNKIWESLKLVFANKSRKITQNGTFDVKFLWKKGITIKNWYCDTILQSHLLNENVGHDLGTIATMYTDQSGYHKALDTYVEEHPEADPRKCLVAENKWRAIKDAVKDGDIILAVGTYENIPRDIMHDYASRDAGVTYQAYCTMLPLLQKQGLLWVLFNIQMPIQYILTGVEYNGVTVDMDYLNKLDSEYVKKIDSAWSIVLSDPKVCEMISELKQNFVDKWNSSKTLKKKYTLQEYLAVHQDKFEFKASTKQLTTLLIGKYKLKPIKFGKIKDGATEGNPSMDKSVLEEYAFTVPICKDIQTWRGYEALYNTFIKGMRNFIANDSRVRSNYPLFTTVTGRPSSLRPNLNNIPRTASEIKGQFVADSGCYIIEADLAQAEFRMWAEFSGDKQMLMDINSGLDIHKITAALAKGKIFKSGTMTHVEFLDLTSDVTKEEREAAKRVVFGMMYGRGAKSIAKQLGISLAHAKRIIQAFFGRYSEAERWLLLTVVRTKRDGYVKNMYGRRRRLIYINQVGHPLQHKAERQAVNAPIQSAASDTNFLAAIRIYRKMQQLKLKARMILTVYDSLIYNVPENELEIVAKLVRHEMLLKTEYIGVQLGCEVKYGTRWGQLKEIKYTSDGTPIFEQSKGGV